MVYYISGLNVVEMVITCYLGYTTNKKKKYLLMEILYLFRNKTDTIRRMLLLKTFDREANWFKGSTRTEKWN